MIIYNYCKKKNAKLFYTLYRYDYLYVYYFKSVIISLWALFFSRKMVNDGTIMRHVQSPPYNATLAKSHTSCRASFQICQDRKNTTRAACPIMRKMLLMCSLQERPPSCKRHFSLQKGGFISVGLHVGSTPSMCSSSTHPIFIYIYFCLIIQYLLL